MLPTKIAFVDIETTGGRIAFDRIIEVGILRIENNTLVESFQTLLNPGMYISPFIENLTGIGSADVELAPTFSEVKDKVQDILSDCVFVAHNVRFDYGFLKNEFKRFNISFSPKHFCTVKLSRYLYPRHTHHNLDSIIERFGISCARRHRAWDDAKVLWDFYQKVQTQFSPKKFEHAVDLAMKKPTLPINISHETLEKLPEGCGVYIFYSKENTPLYIGKSINLKDRIMSHFSQDHASGTEMSISQQVLHIETIETSGELGALFREATLIKELQPLYNRKLRLKRKLVVLRKLQTPDGYDTVGIETLNSISVEDLETIMGIFRSKKQAKEFLISAAKKHSLCQKLLGIEKTKHGCFGYHLGWCRGACQKKEIPIKYNVRFTETFSALKIKTWPFDGPIVIEEKNELENKFEKFIVDKWCYLGSLKSESNDTENYSNEYIFDIDTYKILVSFIFSDKNKHKIQTSPFLKQTPSDYLLQETVL